MLVRITNRKDPDQTAFSDWVCAVCLCILWQATSVRNFRTFTVAKIM